MCAHCRVERVQPEAAAEVRAPHAAAPLVGPATLVAVGLDEAEAQAALAAICQRQRLAADRFSQALGAVECVRRQQRGMASGGAVIVEDERAWGAAVDVPPDYLASEAATWAVRFEGGLHQGSHLMQPVADCPLLAAMPAPTPDGPAPEPEGEVAADADEDAGVDAERRPTGVVFLEGAVSTDAMDPALLFRDDGGHFHVGLLRSGINALAREGSGPAVPVGHELVPGQLVHAGRDGAVVVAAEPHRDPLRAPAPAAEAYMRLQAAKGLAGHAAVGLSSIAVARDPAMPLRRFELTDACAQLGEGAP